MSATDHLPPGPYQFLTTARDGDHLGVGHVYVTDATGRKIASCWGSPDEKLALADLIIKARDKVSSPPAASRKEDTASVAGGRGDTPPPDARGSAVAAGAAPSKVSRG